jgi:hypothetical protein
MTDPAIQTSILPGEPLGPVGLGFPADHDPRPHRHRPTAAPANSPLEVRSTLRRHQASGHQGIGRRPDRRTTEAALGVSAKRRIGNSREEAKRPSRQSESLRQRISPLQPQTRFGFTHDPFHPDDPSAGAPSGLVPGRAFPSSRPRFRPTRPPVRSLRCTRSTIDPVSSAPAVTAQHAPNAHL